MKNVYTIPCIICGGINCPHLTTKEDKNLYVLKKVWKKESSCLKSGK